MNDQTARAQNGEKTETATQLDKPKMHTPATIEPGTARQVAGVEEKMTGFEKATLRWAKVAVSMSALAAIFVCAQWYEMHLGGQDTHALAQAAGTQATKMSNVSDAADKIRQAAQDMVTQDQRVADNAQKAIDASNKQSAAALRASIDASKLNERAWVVLRQIGGLPELNKPWTVQMYFMNTGKTPARNVRMTCHITYTTGESAEPLIRFAETVPDTRPTLIAPNDPNIYCSLDALQPLKIPQVTQDMLDSFSGGKLVFFAHGFVTYEDVVGTKHWMTFCRVMDRDGKTWHGCKTHNDTGDGNPPPN